MRRQFDVTRERAVELALGPIILDGDLVLPAGARGLVLFAHGSGSSRFSPRNRLVARQLQEQGLATLLLDLLTPDESADRALVFDVPLLSRRLEAAAAWLRERPEAAGLPLCFFGASTGAAAALWAAADLGDEVAAVVSRGGRPDLAAERLADVRAATLLVVGGADTAVLELNRSALELLRGERSLEIVPEAGHLFEEPGALERVAALAAAWFLAHTERRLRWES